MCLDFVGEFTLLIKISLVVRTHLYFGFQQKLKKLLKNIDAIRSIYYTAFKGRR